MAPEEVKLKRLAYLKDLFSGKYPGYRGCTTRYHDLNHTLHCFLLMARLIHGAFINGVVFKEEDVVLGLISALMHDTGYLRDHFRVRWGIDQDLDREAIERNIKYLKFILDHHEADYRGYISYEGIKEITSEIRRLEGTDKT